MIELLAALLILAIGAIAMAALQFRMLQSVQATLLQGEAQTLIADMLERIRATVAVGGHAEHYDYLVIGQDPGSVPDCVLQWCSGAELAAFETATWICGFARYSEHAVCAHLGAGLSSAGSGAGRGLPAGQGSIRVDADGLVRITVQWSDRRHLQWLAVTSRI